MNDPRRPILAKLLLDLVNLSKREYFREDSLSSTGMVLLCCALRVAGKPVPASSLCRAARIPRGTCLRRLAALVEIGAVKRVGCLYEINNAYFAREHPVKLSERLVQRAAAELSKIEAKLPEIV